MIASLLIQDPDDKRAENAGKYIKSLLDVHGTAICRRLGYTGNAIYKESNVYRGSTKSTIKHIFTLDDGTIVKVMANA